jgi:hypothetical protein
MAEGEAAPAEPWLDVEKYELLRDVVDKSDAEVHIHVASDVLCIDVPKTAAEIGEVMPDGELPELVGPRQRAVASYKAGAGKGEGAKFSIDLPIVPVSRLRHPQLIRLVVTNIPGDGKTTSDVKKLELEVFASNYRGGRRQTCHNVTGEEGAETYENTLTDEARVCHRLVGFHVEFASERKVTVFIVDQGQVPSVIGYGSKPRSAGRFASPLRRKEYTDWADTRGLPATAPGRDAQPEAGINAALGSAFTYGGKTIPERPSAKKGEQLRRLEKQAPAARREHKADVNVPFLIVPVHRAPDPNDAQPLGTDTWSIKPRLPRGLKLNKDGSISGTAGECCLPRNFVITATNSAGREIVDLTLEVGFTVDEQDRLLKACRDKTLASVALPSAKPAIEEAMQKTLHTTCARIVESSVRHVPEKAIDLKERLALVIPDRVRRGEKIGRDITFARRQQYIVPRDFVTIQDAIEQCPRGDHGGAHIWLLPGQYDGPIVVDRPVHIEAVGPVEETEILHAGEPTVVFVKGGDHAVVSGVSIVRTTAHHQYRAGPAVRVTSGRPSLEHCRVVSESGSCVYLEEGTNGTIKECILFPPFDRSMGAGVYADHDAGGRIIDNLFSADGLDIDAMSTAKIEVQGNRSELITGLDSVGIYEVEVQKHGHRFLRSISSSAADPFDMEDHIKGDVLDAQLYATTQGLSWPKTAAAAPLLRPMHIADGDWNWRKEVTAWNPMMSFSVEKDRDYYIRQCNLAERPPHGLLKSDGTRKGESRSGVLRSVLSTAKRERAASQKAFSESVRPGFSTGSGFSTGLPQTGHGYAANEPLSPLSTLSPTSSVMSPTSPSRSRLRRTKSQSPLSPKSRTFHSERQIPTTHPSVWDQRVVWKQAPAVRMPQRAPGPQTMKMQTFEPPKKPASSGYGIGGHGGAIQNVPIYQR